MPTKNQITAEYICRSFHIMRNYKEESVRTDTTIYYNRHPDSR